MRFRKKVFISIGVLAAVVCVIEAGLTLVGFVFLWQQEQRNHALGAKKDTVRVLCLGESTTAGAYPLFLSEALQRYAPAGMQFSVFDKGVSGSTTDDAREQLEYNLAKYRPEIVVAMLGINESGTTNLPEGIIHRHFSANSFVSLKTYRFFKLLWWSLIDAHKRKTLYGTGTYKNTVVEPVRLQRILLNVSSQGAEPLFKSTALNEGVGLSRNEQYYITLGRLFRKQRQLSEAAAPLQEALRLNPASDGGCSELGRVYVRQERWADAEDHYRHCIKADPQNENNYLRLAYVYMKTRAYEKAQGVLQEALRSGKTGQSALGAVATVCRQQGDHACAEVYRNQSRDKGISFFSSHAAENYRWIWQVLRSRGIALVCVQYPMRSVQPLKDIFTGLSAKPYFIDNEAVFIDAVEHAGYQAYFKDMFGGDFGHCTDKGNMLLAEQIARGMVLYFMDKYGSMKR